MPLINSHLDEVGRFLIVLLAERNYLAHGNIIPIGKWTYDMRNFSTFNWLKVRVYISHTVNFISIILSKVLIFNL